MIVAPAALALALVATPPTAIRPCLSERNCISSLGRESPNQFSAPLSYAPRQKNRAYEELEAKLTVACTGVEADRFYIRATCGGNLVEFDVRDSIAAFRLAAVVKSPTPPWCIAPGCINGHMPQRNALARLAKDLGWSPIDSTQLEDDSRWTPIFFNADAVPRDE
ncbi:hypothetical protein CTAYLR_001105 [Chrysophaeum taylorii]|uniref:Uncharacterized protein n=1 Tax=Chrysophaeum taylorii TaxID=2483200 RepID=A0AAD7XUM7_9STRA|nr:hypothetical protein CTAYLR_001105 [Chrysophaeum taylorii]